jgi:hypothetical protein
LVDGAVAMLCLKVILATYLVHRTLFNDMMIASVILSIAIINLSFVHRLMLLIGESARSGSANPCRVLFFPCRISSVAITIWNLIDLYQSPNLLHALELIGFGLWLSGCYIGSCSRRPLQTNHRIVFA